MAQTRVDSEKQELDEKTASTQKKIKQENETKAEVSLPQLSGDDNDGPTNSASSMDIDPSIKSSDTRERSLSATMRNWRSVKFSPTLTTPTAIAQTRQHRSNSALHTASPNNVKNKSNSKLQSVIATVMSPSLSFLKGYKPNFNNDDAKEMNHNLDEMEMKDGLNDDNLSGNSGISDASGMSGNNDENDNNNINNNNNSSNTLKSSMKRLFILQNISPSQTPSNRTPRSDKKTVSLKSKSMVNFKNSNGNNNNSNNSNNNTNNNNSDEWSNDMNNESNASLHSKRRYHKQNNTGIESNGTEEEKKDGSMNNTVNNIKSKLDDKTKQMKSDFESSFNKLARKTKRHLKNVASPPPLFLKLIPQNCVKLWKDNHWLEMNRFSKLSAQAQYVHQSSNEKKNDDNNNNDNSNNDDSNHNKINWDERISTDLIRAGKLFVDGDIHEVFEFPNFKSHNEKLELVKATIQYLERAIQYTLNKHYSNSLDNDACIDLSHKIVRQILISLCQEFVNDPYFKYLKESCNNYNLQPVDIGLIGNQDINSIKSWTPRLVIQLSSNENNTYVYTHVVRVFQCYQLSGIEAIESDIYFGFKRTYAIDCLGGPPQILSPIWLAKNNQVAYEIAIPDPSDLDKKYGNIFGQMGQKIEQKFRKNSNILTNSKQDKNKLNGKPNENDKNKSNENIQNKNESPSIIHPKSDFLPRQPNE